MNKGNRSNKTGFDLGQPSQSHAFPYEKMLKENHYKQPNDALMSCFYYLTEVLNDGVCIIDGKGKIDYANNAFVDLLETNLKTVYRKPFFEILNIKGTEEEKKSLSGHLFDTIIENRVNYSTDEIILMRADNTLVPVRLSLYPYFKNDHMDKVIVHMQDLAAMRHQLAQIGDNTKNTSSEYLESSFENSNTAFKLEYFETHDNLTGLFNRQYFKQQLDYLMASCKKLNCEHMVLYLDLDQFKVINDTYSSEVGDELLSQIAALIKSKVRKWDIVARLGDDEFGLILLYCSQHHAVRIAEVLRDAIREFEYTNEDIHFTISVSAGLVPVNVKSDSTEAIMSKADTACQVAKDEGSDRVYLFQEDDERVVSRYGEVASVSKINKALETDGFVLYSQEIRPIDEGENYGKHYEILLRLLGDDGKIVPPNLFLPAAERYNLISKVDRWVFRQTCKMLMAEPRYTEELEKVSINLSGQSLNDELFSDFIIETLNEYPVPVETICFEITETGTIANLNHALKFIAKLKAVGISFALDDFGSGLSSFGYLKSLPVDYLKIDGLFIKDISNDEIDLAMVKSINEIGHIMGKKTIAEYVEDKDSLERLKGLGVDFVQGYGIAKPEPFIDFLKRK